MCTLSPLLFPKKSEKDMTKSAPGSPTTPSIVVTEHKELSSVVPKAKQSVRDQEKLQSKESLQNKLQNTKGTR